MIIAAAIMTMITGNHVTKSSSAVIDELIADDADDVMPVDVLKFPSTVSPTPSKMAISTKVSTAGYIS